VQPLEGAPSQIIKLVEALLRVSPASGMGPL
jgi:hypothetical protein